MWVRLVRFEARRKVTAYVGGMWYNRGQKVIKRPIIQPTLMFSRITIDGASLLLPRGESLSTALIRSSNSPGSPEQSGALWR